MSDDQHVIAHTETGIVHAGRTDPISITKSGGVVVGGKQMTGCTKWEVSRDYAQGITEVRLTLVTSALKIDLEAGPNAGIL